MFFKSFNEYKILAHEKDTLVLLKIWDQAINSGKTTYLKKFVSRFQCIFVENRYTNYCRHLRNVKLLSVGGQNGILVFHKNLIYWQYLEIHVLFNFLNKRFQHRNLGFDKKGSISRVISIKREGMRLYMCLDTISFEWLFLIFVLSRHKKSTMRDSIAR